jgi:type IV secretion system protein TrbL
MMMRSIGALGGAVAATAQTGSRVAGTASTAYGPGAAGKEAGSAIAGGLANVAKTAANRASTPIGSAIGSAQEKTAESVKEGSCQAFAANGGATTKDQASSDTQSQPESSSKPGKEMTEGSSEPQWARSLRDQQHLMHGVNALNNTIRSGDARGGGASPDLSDNS